MDSQENPDETDTFNLARFIEAQKRHYETALSELQKGKKRSHWIWFIFPQIDGLGTSATARKYAIQSLDEARAYLHHPVLGPRLLECCEALLVLEEGKSASQIMGYPDDLKLRSSMTLFSVVADSEKQFQAVLDQYYGGETDDRTISIVEGSAHLN